MATTTKDSVRIANIIKHEIKKRKKQKKAKENSKDVEEDNMSLLKKIEKKMKEKKTSTHLTTILHKKKAKKFYTTICDENDKYLNKEEIGANNFNKNELIKCILISNASEDERELILFKKRKKKKKRDKKKEQNNKNLKTDKTILKTQKLYTEICDDNDKQMNKHKTEGSNLHKDEFTRRIPIANASEGNSFKKKKKKKKEDKKMVQKDEHLKNDIVTLRVKKFYTETCDDNDNYLNKDKKMASNLNKDELTKRIPIANASESNSFQKKKKKKKKGDKKMLQNDENLNNDKVTLKVEKFYNESCDDNDKHLNKDKTVDSNLNKDELKRSISIANASESDSLFKKKKKKKKLDKLMVQNDENLKNNEPTATLKVEKSYTKTYDDNINNNKHLYRDESMDSNLNKDEFTRRIPIADVSEGDLLFKKKKKKKNRDSKMVQKNKHLKDDKATLKVEQFYNETIDDSVKYLNKINISASNLNKNNLTTRIQISKASKFDRELTLLKIPLKKTKKKKKKSKMTIKDDVSESTKYEATQKNLKDMVDLKKYISEEQSNEIHNDSSMINIPYNSGISKVHEQYPELFQKLLNTKKKDKKKSIKVLTSKEVIPLKKTNKRKREATDKEYSKNDSLQSVVLDMETCDNINYIGEDGGKKLECFDSRDDTTSEYRNMTDTDSTMINTTYCSRTSKIHEGECPEVVHELFKNKKKEQKKVIKVQCDICFKTFIRKYDLYVHKRRHIGDKPYLCNVCGRSFSRKGDLVRHIRMHTGEKPYACNVCGQSFSQQGTLVTHKRTHTGEKPYACNVCGQSFSQQGTLVTHKRTHTGEKPYACSFCGQSFTKKGNLVTHERTHTGEKPFVCNVCGRSFSHHTNFVVHHRIHTGERPFECGYCEKKFSSSGGRAKHTRRIHTKCF